MANQDYGQHDDQQEQVQMPDSTGDSPPQTAGMPDVQRDQGQNYDDQNSPEGWSPGQQVQGAPDDTDNSPRGDQSQTQDQRQASDEGQTTDTDDDYGKGLTGGQWKNQSDQDY